MLLAMKFKVAATLAAFASPLAASVVTPVSLAPAATTNVAETVQIAPANFAYRLAGDFSKDTTPATAPLRNLRLDGGLSIMKRQVTAAEYAICVNEGECPALASSAMAADRPVVGVSWRDATAYAKWLSRKTGLSYRLPTDEEWVFAAATRANDDAVPLPEASDDPSKVWLARYESESSKVRPVATAPQPTGSFGANENGLLDVGGNVWEWTDSCFIRAKIEANGTTRTTATNCGVRVVQGAHRAYMTDFVRDPRAGGCAAGVPPANLGFRLVLERAPGIGLMVARGAARLLAGAGIS